MEKINMSSFKDKRRKKSAEFNYKVDSDFINNIVGDYNFDNWGVSYLDVSNVDFSKLSLEDMTHIAFSSSTVFGDRLPLDYNPYDILKNSITVGKDIKALHDSGINGEGVTIAVIDSGFQAENHLEFKEANLIKCTLNEEGKEYHFHMENVLAKLCGKNLGSAPKSKVLYYETSMDDDFSEEVRDCLKDVLKRIKGGENVRAVSCSFSLTNAPQEPYKYEKECYELVNELKSYNCDVIDSCLFGENFMCCGTTFLNNEENINEYKTAHFMKNRVQEAKEKCNVVCSGRAVLEFCNDEGYKYEVVECFSWTIPFVVGLYSLCLQADPKLNFDEFTKLCVETSNVNCNDMKVINIKKVINNLIEKKDNLEDEKNEFKRKQRKNKKIF